MGTLASDNFDRADNADLGANWTPSTFGGSWKVISNHAEPAADADAVEYWNALSWPNDQWAQGDLTVATTGLEAGCGIALRVDDPSQNLYWCVADQSGVFVAKFVGGTYSLISSITQTWTAGNTLRFEAEGSALRVFDNGAQIDAGITDSSIASGSAGVAYSSSLSTRQLDNWVGGDFAAAAVTDEAKLRIGRSPLIWR